MIWEQIKSQIYHICCKEMNYSDDADDVFQEAALRIWRGFPSFSYNSSVLTWAITITKNEINRALRKKIIRVKATLPLDDYSENAGDKHREPERKVVKSVEKNNWLSDIVELGKQAETINDLEYKVVKARLVHPDEQWQEISELVDVSASRCAVEHSRAIPKLCVLLFTNYPEKLGGRALLGNLLQKQLIADSSFMSAEEIAAFKNIVVEGSRRYTKAGWRTHLRSACGKMIKFIPNSKKPDFK